MATEDSVKASMLEINTLYFVALREAAMQDVGRACAEFAVDSETALFVRDTDLPALINLVQTPRTLLRPALNANGLELLANADPSQRRAMAALQGA